MNGELNMRGDDDQRIVFRREVYDANQALVDLIVRLTPHDPSAAAAIKQARSSLFEAWTVLCVPPDDHEDEDH
jgi:hypothetical protein